MSSVNTLIRAFNPFLTQSDSASRKRPFRLDFFSTGFFRPFFFLFFFFSSPHFHFAASGQAVVTGVIPPPPRFLPSIFIAHRVQQSHCSSIVHRVLLTHALALSSSHFVHKEKSQRIYATTHSAGLELTKLTYTRLENNLIRHAPPGRLIVSRVDFIVFVLFLEAVGVREYCCMALETRLEALCFARSSRATRASRATNLRSSGFVALGVAESRQSYVRGVALSREPPKLHQA